MVTFGCEIWVPGINGQKPCCATTSRRHKEIKYVGSDHPRFPSLRMRTPSLPASMMADGVEDDGCTKGPPLKLTDASTRRALETINVGTDLPAVSSAKPKRSGRFLGRLFGGGSVSAHSDCVNNVSPTLSSTVPSPVSESDIFKPLGLPAPNENWHRHGTFTMHDNCASSQESGTSLTGSDSTCSNAEDMDAPPVLLSSVDSAFFSCGAQSSLTSTTFVGSDSNLASMSRTVSGHESLKSVKKAAIAATAPATMRRNDSEKHIPTTPTKSLNLKRIWSLSTSTILGSGDSVKSSPEALEPVSISGGKSQQSESGECAQGETPLCISFDKPTKLLSKYGVCCKGDKGVIGRGATACVKVVHCLEDTKPGKKYAVKEFRKISKSESRRQYVKRLASEFCISSSLKHPNIVQTVDLVIDENDRWCEVMEYCGGGDLYSVIRNCKLTSGEIDCVFKQLINGVAYLHSVGVAHRDLKPENLLFDKRGLLKITDFGGSEVFRTAFEMDPHMSHGLCGSEPYIPPEEFALKEYDPQEVDIWACGIVYYAMTYAGVPWAQAVPSDPNYCIYCRNRDPPNFPPLSALQPGCANLMYQILDPDPNNRIRLSEIQQDSWFRSIKTCCESEYKVFGEDDAVAACSGGNSLEHHHTTNPTICPLKP